MSLHWLLLLWPLLGYLGWAWANYIITRTCSNLDGKWMALGWGLLIGPGAIFVTALIALSVRPEHRWGLRFR